ncbi:MAG: SusC/RagA family TonB-linked outer membrane protein [Flavobacteriaceae bacterium]|jgi:TonB-linked SusC/RagA family outer membrane protein|nr:SusC/RagA family TonB-linked outer membrane protein [Flavobacteriaceae bacterium]
MKKLTVSMFAVVLSSSFFVTVNAQNKPSDTATVGIEEVVVTALGIKREKKALGYASQEVKSDALFDGTTNTGNIAANLSGKIAGLNVNTNSNFGGAVNLILRGVRVMDLNGANPLVVIDGVPVGNNATRSGNANGGFDFGNALSDINQEDVESINVLKGAAASALYGERGLGGVIVITTKNGKGKDDGSWGVTLSSNITAGFIDKSTFAEYQTKYGTGYFDPGGFPYWPNGADSNGYNIVGFDLDASWGPEFDGSLVRYWDSYDPTSPTFGQARPWKAADNGPLSFYQTPMSYNNSVSIGKNTDTGSFLLTYDNTMSNGLLPNSDLRKNTISAKINYDFTPKLHASVYSTLTLQDMVGRNETGYNNNITTGFRQWWQVNTDLIDLRDAYFRNIGIASAANNYGNVTWNRISVDNGRPAFWNNPYFQSYQSYESDNRVRSFSYASLTYDIDKHWNVMGRIGYDRTNFLIERRLAVGSYPIAFGVSGRAVGSGYDRIDINNSEMNLDLIASYKYDITDNINISGIVGGTVKRINTSSVEASTEGGLTLPGLYALGNSAGTTLAPAENVTTQQTNSGYVSASLEFYKTFYLDGTYRRDVSTTLPDGDNAYGYGSISGSLLLSELLGLQDSKVNFWKIRGNYAEVGNTALPYQLKYSYTSSGFFNGIGMYGTPTTFPNTKLKPQRTKEYEFGTEAHFFNNRIIFDAAYYNTSTFDQIINVSSSVGSGQLAKIINAGQIDNSGIEASLSIVPIKNQNFTWTLDANWAKNKNKVVELYGDTQAITLVGMVGASVVARVGEAWGNIFGSDYVYLNGQKVVDPDDGTYLINPSQVIGNVNPEWTGGVRNTITYKNFSLSFLIDIRKGGDVFSSDLYYGLASGLYPETAVDGYRSVQAVLPGVNPNGQPNTTPVLHDVGFDSNGDMIYVYPADGYGYNAADSYAMAPSKRFVYDGSFVKLREASITYSLPKSLLHGTFLNEAKISIVGRNLWIIHKNLPYSDPEATQMGGIYSYGSSIGALPTTRDIGVNLTFKF